MVSGFWCARNVAGKPGGAAVEPCACTNTRRRIGQCVNAGFEPCSSVVLSCIHERSGRREGSLFSGQTRLIDLSLISSMA